MKVVKPFGGQGPQSIRLTEEQETYLHQLEACSEAWAREQSKVACKDCPKLKYCQEGWDKRV